MFSDPRLREAIASAALVALVLTLFHRMLFGETLFFRDLYLLYLPSHAQFAASVLSGHFPAWDSLRHGGMSALGPQIGPFSPSFLPYLVLPPVTAMNVVLVGHILLAALGARFLGRRLGLTGPSSWAAGAVYGLSGYLLSAINLHQPLFGLAWGPLAAGLAVTFFRGGGWKPLLGLAVALAVPVLSTSAETAGVSAAFVLLFALFPVRGAIPFRRRLGGVLLALLLAGGLAAIQILPSLEKVRESSRAGGVSFESFSFNSVDPLRLPELVIPGFFGPVDTLRDEDYWGRRREDPGFPNVLSIYVGALALSLAGIGGLSRDGALPQGLRRALLATAALGVLLSLGRHLPGFHLLYDMAGPLRSFRYPVKAMAVLPLPVALLAGVALDRIAAGKDRSSRLPFLPIGVGIVLLAAAGLSVLAPPLAGSLERVFFLEPLELASRARLIRSLLHAGLFATLGGLLWVRVRVRVRGRERRCEATAWSLAGLLAVDLLFAGGPLVPTAPREALAPPPLVLEAARLVGEGRLFRDGDPARFPLSAPTNELVHLMRRNLSTLRFYTAAGFGIPVVFHDDYDRLAPRRVMALGDRLRREPWSRRVPVLRAAGVSVVATWSRLEVPGLVEAVRAEEPGGQGLRLYRVEGSTRARFVSRRREAHSGKEALGMLLSRADPLDEVILETPSAEGGSCGSFPLTVTFSSPEALGVSVEAPCQGWIVLAENHAPGWEAWKDGVVVPVLHADFAFRAVEVTVGRHRVEMRYRSLPFLRGAAISLATLTALGAALVAGAWPRRRRESDTIHP